ncbi:DciA family protein [Gryllotalpicola kribbensis]|uniref:DciA family protein n=1 Tax=Gryllotalpicola kribbensis TaxID=993084 RepID=A0ABP8ASE1_9MICO
MNDSGDEPRSEASAVYLRLKKLFGGPSARSSKTRRRAESGEPGSEPFGAGRDPRGLSSVMDALTTELGWDSELDKAELIGAWSELVGESTASKSQPLGIEDGVLTVQCESTAWATQLRIMRVELLTAIAQRYPRAGIQSIRFNGPDVPSWKYGRRSTQWRGPRDTYG